MHGAFIRIHKEWEHHFFLNNKFSAWKDFHLSSKLQKTFFFVPFLGKKEKWMSQIPNSSSRNSRIVEYDIELAMRCLMQWA